MHEKKPPNGKTKKPPAPPTAANDPILARYYADIHAIAVSLDAIATVTPAEKMLYADIHSIGESLESIDGNIAASAAALESINESLQENNTKLLVILAQIAECVCGSNVNAQSSTLTLEADNKRE